MQRSVFVSRVWFAFFNIVNASTGYSNFQLAKDSGGLNPLQITPWAPVAGYAEHHEPARATSACERAQASGLVGGR